MPNLKLNNSVLCLHFLCMWEVHAFCMLILHVVIVWLSYDLQVGNWVAHSILQFDYLEERAEVIQQFIAIAKVYNSSPCFHVTPSSLPPSLSPSTHPLLQHCFDFGNYSSVMAIVVAGLGSAPVRRLHSSWSQVPKADMELFKEMDTLLDSRVRAHHTHLLKPHSFTAPPISMMTTPLSAPPLFL